MSPGSAWTITFGTPCIISLRGYKRNRYNTARGVIQYLTSARTQYRSINFKAYFKKYHHFRMLYTSTSFRIPARWYFSYFLLQNILETRSVIVIVLNGNTSTSYISKASKTVHICIIYTKGKRKTDLKSPTLTFRIKIVN